MKSTISYCVLDVIIKGLIFPPCGTLCRESLWANRKLGEIIQQHRLSLSHSRLSIFFTSSSIPLFVLAIMERNTFYLRQKHRPAHFDAYFDFLFRNRKYIHPFWVLQKDAIFYRIFRRNDVCFVF